jgi:hypothetical protein
LDEEKPAELITSDRACFQYARSQRTIHVGITALFALLTVLMFALFAVSCVRPRWNNYRTHMDKYPWLGKDVVRQMDTVRGVTYDQLTIGQWSNTVTHARGSQKLKAIYTLGEISFSYPMSCPERNSLFLVLSEILLANDEDATRFALRGISKGLSYARPMRFEDLHGICFKRIDLEQEVIERILSILYEVYSKEDWVNQSSILEILEFLMKAETSAAILVARMMHEGTDDRVRLRARRILEQHVPCLVKDMKTVQAITAMESSHTAKSVVPTQWSEYLTSDSSDASRCLIRCPEMHEGQLEKLTRINDWLLKNEIAMCVEDLVVIH